MSLVMTKEVKARMTKSQKEKSPRCKQNKYTITTTCNTKHNTTNHQHAIQVYPQDTSQKPSRKQSMY